MQTSLQKGGVKVNARKSEVTVSSKVRADVPFNDVTGEEIRQGTKLWYLSPTLAESGESKVVIEEKNKKKQGGESGGKLLERLEIKGCRGG